MSCVGFVPFQLMRLLLRRGHIAEVTSCAWHPTQRNTFLTASHDSTLRLWDTERMDKSKSVIVVKSKARGQRTQVTSSAWTNDGKYIAAAGSDGALYVWGTNSNFVRPNYVSVSCAYGRGVAGVLVLTRLVVFKQSTEKICEPGSQISGMSFSLDNHTLTTRGTDNTVKCACQSHTVPFRLLTKMLFENSVGHASVEETSRRKQRPAQLQC